MVSTVIFIYFVPVSDSLPCVVYLNPPLSSIYNLFRATGPSTQAFDFYPASFYWYLTAFQLELCWESAFGSCRLLSTAALILLIIGESLMGSEVEVKTSAAPIYGYSVSMTLRADLFN